MVGEVVFQQFNCVSSLRKGSGGIDPLMRKANFALCPNLSARITSEANQRGAAVIVPAVIGALLPVIEISAFGASFAGYSAASGRVWRMA